MLIKKFYTLALAASIAMSASAATELSDALNSHVKKSLKESIKDCNKKAAVKFSRLKATDNPVSIDNLAGEYDWYFYDYRQSGGFKKGSWNITITDATKGEVHIDMAGWDIAGTYDEATATLSIAANQDLGYDDVNMIQVYLYHGFWNADGTNGGFTDSPFELKFNGTEFEFPTVTGTGQMAGEVFATDLFSIGNENLGWFLVAGDNEVFRHVPFEQMMPAGDWTSIGTGTFTDGWQMIAYVGNNYTSYKWLVDVEQNSLNPNIFRIHNPYNTSACPIYQYNDNASGTGNIVFSIEDPEFVVVYPYILSGLEDEMGSYLNSNLEGYYSILGGYSKAEIISAGILDGVSVYANGKVTFNNCIFGTETEPDETYTWTDQANNPLIGPSYLEIELPVKGSAVNEISASSANAPVKYFNLQGVEIENPRAGQLVIRRQGSESTKIIAK